MMAPRITCHCGACLKCKRRKYMRDWYRRDDNAERQRQSQLASRNRRIEQVREFDRARGHRSYDPFKEAARRKLTKAILRGFITPPKTCESCGLESVPNNGRRTIQAHHHDYSQPLDVIWLCVKCHGVEHRRVAGEAA